MSQRVGCRGRHPLPSPLPLAPLAGEGALRHCRLSGCHSEADRCSQCNHRREEPRNSPLISAGICSRAELAGLARGVAAAAARLVVAGPAIGAVVVRVADARASTAHETRGASDTARAAMRGAGLQVRLATVGQLVVVAVVEAGIARARAEPGSAHGRGDVVARAGLGAPAAVRRSRAGVGLAAVGVASAAITETLGAGSDRALASNARR